MEREYKRYSIAWVPVPGTALAEFGKQWTGWCSASGQYGSAYGEWDALKTAARVGRFPGRRGLHAPLTKPFTLGEGVSRWFLETVLEEFASQWPSEYITPPVLRVENERVVMAPERRSDRLNDMMAELQQELQPFVTYDTGPSPQSFSLPLTDIVGPRTSDMVLMELAPRLVGMVGPKPLIASLSLVALPTDCQSWRMLDRYVLAGQADDARSGPATMSCLGPDLLATTMSL